MDLMPRRRLARSTEVYCMQMQHKTATLKEKKAEKMEMSY